MDMETQTNEFYIQKIRMPVALTLTGGESLKGELFIQASARNLSALEDAPEFMNSSEPFFPLRLPDGETLLISKSHVLTVHVDREFAASVEWAFGDRVSVEVAMQGGATHHGHLQVEHYVGHARVLDYLNRGSEPFVLLLRETEVLLLNRRHIAYVRPVDDATT
jgi:hypothetical protein